ncbi:MAG: PP2C family protein-serine/threonine phosphatase [Longimicrobiaceae bacterium]
MPAAPTVPAPPADLPASLREVVEEFERRFSAEVRLWMTDRSGAWRLLWGSRPEFGREPGAEAVPVGLADAGLRVEVEDTARPDTASASAAFLAAMLERTLRYEREMRAVSGEIAERYEEITLLYTISEILGSVISLEEAAGTILAEVGNTLGARRATLWVHDPDADLLRRTAGFGDTGAQPPVRVTDPCSVTAEVFRERRPLILAADEEYERAGCPEVFAPRDTFLSVPVSYTPPEGETRTVGVISVTGRDPDDPFSAGDLKLLSAIASQVGAAVENNLLVAATLEQERVVREIELAHDLQLKLLPPTGPLAGYAEVAARMVPAESVGGDFYHLFRLPGGSLGVMIGDVSSHGFRAALIMALTMSAVAIHASEGDPPARVLRRVHRALIDELTSTEMYLTLFYGVLDPDRRRICYANAGHPHAFRVGADGSSARLAATSAPLGIAQEEDYAEEEDVWSPGGDLLFLFTDGLSDAVGEDSAAGERVLLEQVVLERDRPLEGVIENLFALPSVGAVPADDRTALLARI